MAVARPRPCTWCSRTNYWKVCAPAPLPWRARAMAPALNSARDFSFSNFHSHLFLSSQILSTHKSLTLPYQHPNSDSSMDKKGKAKRPVCKMYASQAAARSEATSKPPTAHKAPEEPKKNPIFIDLTADSESEDTTRASSESHFSSVASCSEGHSAPR
ncbi:hypothetical protein PIB30_019735 [Stylosanthes scabra]|uniref:Uncharacterized protein n=1 Tax=Stylosanthes scabra TaxID=79078 RepID=A0ABU6W9I9_9FABA|nr:hypothetical protein [Stylosanthes scabra]